MHNFPHPHRFFVTFPFSSSTSSSSLIESEFSSSFSIVNVSKISTASENPLAASDPPATTVVAPL
jgi:hypothetical protein